MRHTPGTNGHASAWGIGNALRNTIRESTYTVVPVLFVALLLPGIMYGQCDTVQVGISGARSICAGEQVTLLADSGFVSYSWNTGSTNQSIRVSAGGTYTVTVVDGNNCVTSSTITLVVHQPPVLSIGKREFCQGDSTTLDAGPGYVSYDWITGSTAQSIIVKTSGIYRISVVDSNGCGASEDVLVTVHPLPAATAGASVLKCGAAPVQLQAQGGISYEWQPAAHLSDPHIANPLANPPATTTYSVVVTDANGCQAVTSVTVHVYPAPTLSISGTSAVCSYETATLAAIGNFERYSWSNGSTAASITVGPGSYNLTAVNANGCSSSASFTLAALPLPDAQVGPDTAICVGQSVELRADGGVQYLWFPATGLSSTSSATPLATPRATTEYTVQVWNAQGCHSSTSVTVVVHPLPEVQISGLREICAGEFSVLSVDPVYESYRWSNGETTNNIVVRRSGTYSVQVTNANGCSNTGSAIVVVHPLPVAQVSADTAICPGGSAQLHASGGTLYGWQPAESLDNPDIANPLASPSTTTTYTVFVRNAMGCVTSSTVTVRVENLNLRVQALPDADICAGDIAELRASPGFARYIWSNGATTQSIFVATAGTYTLRVVSPAGCEQTSSAEVKVYPRPVAIADDTVICAGETTRLRAGGGISYSWFPPEAFSDPSSPNPIVRPSATTTFTVRVMDANGCSDTAQVKVVVEPLPAPDVQADPGFEICNGGSVTLDAGPGYADYRWSTGERSQSITVNRSGVFRLTLRSEFGCMSTTEWEVTIHEAPVADAGRDTAICIGQQVLLGASGGVSYKWSPAGSLSNPDVAHPLATPLETTTYTVVVTDANGCTAEDQVTITVNPLPEPEIFGETALCQGSEEIYDVSGLSGAEYTWRVFGGEIVAGQGTNLVTVRWSESGIGTLEVEQRTSAECVGIDELDVEVFPAPQPRIHTGGVGAIICEGESVELRLDRSYASMEWNTGQSSTTSIIANASGVYSVRVTDENGCTASSSLSIIVRPLPILTSADTVDFGDILACTQLSTTAILQLNNLSLDGATVTIAGIDIDAPFGITLSTGAEISSGASLDVPLSFGPLADGFTSGVLRLRLEPCNVIYRVVLTGRRTFTGLSGTQTADFGFVQTGKRSTQALVFVNDGTVNLEIDRLEHVTAPFTLAGVNPALPAHLAPGDTLHVRLEFAPATNADYRFELVAGGTQPCAISTSAHITARAVLVDPHPSVVVDETRSLLDFGRVLLGTSTGGNVVLLNNGNIDAVIQSAVWLDDAGGAFSLVNPGLLPQPLATTASLPLAVNFAPQTLGTVQARLLVETDVGSVEAVLSGTGVDFLPTIRVVMGNLRAGPDESVVIPLILRRANADFLSSTAATFDAEAVYNRSLLFPRAGSCRQVSTHAGLCRLPFSGAYSAGTDTLALIPFITAIGDSEATALMLEKMQFREEYVKVEVLHGRFELDNVCIGLRRLIDVSGRLSLFHARPNPAGQRTEVEYEVIEHGRTSLRLTDKLGRTVLTVLDAPLAAGRYTVPVDLSALASGAYYIVLQTPTQVLTRRLEVLK